MEVGVTEVMSMCVVNELRNIVTCPNCRRKFVTRDRHAPVRCPHCGAVIDFHPASFEPFVLFSPAELVAEGD